MAPFRASRTGRRVIYADRAEAGRLLGAELKRLHDSDPLILGLPRGGVPVADEIAALLDAPLDVLLIGKLGVPWHQELAMGAIGEDGVVVTNDSVVRQLGISTQQWDDVVRAERAKLERRAARYAPCRSPIPVAGRVVVLVDDGIATGATARAACEVARARGASRILLAAPVIAAEMATRLADCCDEGVYLHVPDSFGAVSVYYADFSATSEEEVMSILRRGGGSRSG